MKKFDINEHIDLETLDNIEKVSIIVNTIDNKEFTKYNNVSDLYFRLNDGTYRHFTTKNMTKEELTLFSKCLRQAVRDAKNEGELVTDELENINNKKDVKRIRQSYEGLGYGAIATRAALITGATVLTGSALAGAYQLGKRNNETPVVPPVGIENGTDQVIEDLTPVVNRLVKPDMTGQNWDYYMSFYADNNLDIIQNKEYAKAMEFALAVNNSESWMKRTNLNGDEAIFGFSAREIVSFMLRMNDYTKEEMVSLYNGMEINPVEVMELSNNFMEKYQTYLVLSTNPVSLSMLVNNEEDKKVIDEFNEVHIKNQILRDSDKHEEAMQNRRQMYYDYFNSDVAGKETKAATAATSIVLRTHLVADSIISRMYQYKDTEVIFKIISESEIARGKSGETKAKTDLFGEQMMRTFVLGWEGFDQKTYLGKLGFNSNNYYVLVDDVARSIANMSCGPQEAMLNAAADKVETVTQTNEIVDSILGVLAPEQLVQINDIVKPYAELIEYTYNRELIEEMFDAKLKELGKYPEYAETFQELITEMSIAIWDKLNAKSKGTTGPRKTAPLTGNLVSTTNPEDVDAVVGSDARLAAEIAAAHAAGAIHETEVPKKVAEATASYQEAYDATFNHYAGKKVRNATKKFNPGWATSSNQWERLGYAHGKEHGLKWKADNAKDGTLEGGEITPVVPKPINPPPADPIPPIEDPIDSIIEPDIGIPQDPDYYTDEEIEDIYKDIDFTNGEDFQPVIESNQTSSNNDNEVTHYSVKELESKYSNYSFTSFDKNSFNFSTPEVEEEAVKIKEKGI